MRWPFLGANPSLATEAKLIHWDPPQGPNTWRYVTLQKDFQIRYRGKNSRLHVELKNDGGDEVDIWFVGDQALAKEINEKMKER
jgi:hypothetical protein